MAPLNGQQSSTDFMETLFQNRCGMVVFPHLLIIDTVENKTNGGDNATITVN